MPDAADRAADARVRDLAKQVRQLEDMSDPDLAAVLARKRAKLGRYKQSLADGANKRQGLARYSCLGARAAIDASAGPHCGSGFECPTSFDCVKATEENNSRCVGSGGEEGRAGGMVADGMASRVPLVRPVSIGQRR